jgi:hypothetical protein
MYGDPIPRPANAIVLRQHWQYHIKHDGTRRACNCCDGSPRAAPSLHKYAQTYSSCVEQPVQRLSAELGYRVYGGDAKDAYAHSPAPERPTYVEIDHAYADWYYHRHQRHGDRSKVLPVQHALQGHPESRRLWEEHISKILHSSDFDFRSTTHDKSIYRGTFKGTPIFMLRQVDDFALAVPNENMVRVVYSAIGDTLKLPTEEDPPFSYLGLLKDYNGVDVHQFDDRTVLNCETYIDRVLRTHGWTTPSAESDRDSNKPQSPIPAGSIAALYASKGPAEGTTEHTALATKYGFGYRNLVGELMYPFVTCRPDVGYAVITLSKFLHRPHDLHFAMLKKVTKYLRCTKSWGIATLSADPHLPAFPELEPGLQLTGFLDAAHGNDLRKRRSTTGFAFQLAGGCISYKCKTQSTTATSSTEAGFYAAVIAAKQARYLRSILTDLGFRNTIPPHSTAIISPPSTWSTPRSPPSDPATLTSNFLPSKLGKIPAPS